MLYSYEWYCNALIIKLPVNHIRCRFTILAFKHKRVLLGVCVFIWYVHDLFIYFYKRIWIKCIRPGQLCFRKSAMVRSGGRRWVWGVVGGRGCGSRDPEVSLLGRATIVEVGLCASGGLVVMAVNGRPLCKWRMQPQKVQNAGVIWLKWSIEKWSIKPLIWCILHETVEECLGMPRVPYKKIRHGEVVVCGMPGLPFKTPGSYSRKELQVILQHQGNITFQGNFRDTSWLNQEHFYTVS